VIDAAHMLYIEHKGGVSSRPGNLVALDINLVIRGQLKSAIDAELSWSLNVWSIGGRLEGHQLRLGLIRRIT
jgi:hypothetical protein